MEIYLFLSLPNKKWLYVVSQLYELEKSEVITESVLDTSTKCELKNFIFFYLLVSLELTCI